MFVLEPILTEGIAQLSYLFADTTTGAAAVIDPRTDVGIYEQLTRKHGVSITHIFETHRCLASGKAALPPSFLIRGGSNLGFTVGSVSALVPD